MSKHTTETPNRSRWRSALQGGLGFALAGLVSLLFLGMIYLTKPAAWLAGLIPDEQVFAKLLTRLLFLIVWVLLSGAVFGMVSGVTLSYVDPQAPPRRYVVSGMIAYLLHGLLLMGFLLLTALIGTVDNNYDQSMPRFTLLFSLYGLIYGLVIGFPLGLLTIGWRHAWRVWLGAIVGYSLGGALLGVLAWLASGAMERGARISSLLLLLGGFLAIFAVGGAVLGIVFNWIAQHRAEQGSLPGRVSRIWGIIGIIVAVVLIYGLGRLGIKMYSFVTIQEGSLSSQIGLPTTSVAWAEPVSIAGRDVQTSPGLAQAVGGPNQSAVVWANASEMGADIFLNIGELDSALQQTIWDAPINVSNTSANESSQAAVAATPEGGWLVSWVEASQDGDSSGQTEIWLAECQAGGCQKAVQVSNPADTSCSASSRTVHAPALAVTADGRRMLVWRDGNATLVYSTWLADSAPPETPSGCIAGQAAGGDVSIVATRLNTFELAFSGAGGGGLFATSFVNNAWSDSQPVGEGDFPRLFQSADGHTHLAYCGNAGELVYRPPTGEQVQWEMPVCLGQPGLGEDATGRLHIVWPSNQIENNSGIVTAGDFLYETIFTSDGLTPPALIIQLEEPARPALANDPNGVLYLAWEGAERTAMQSVQLDYQCTQPPATQIGQAILAVMQTGDFRPEGTPIPYCQNQFERLLFAPEPPPELPVPSTPNGAYDTVGAILVNTKYELLFTTMEWQADENLDSPGFLLTDAVVELYNRLKADPAAYPRGLTIRILLGNYPSLSTLEWGDQIYHVMEDLAKAGLPELVNPELGWKVEVANFDGQLPHGHTKFLVVDGKTTLSAGFNYSYLHFASEHDSGKGEALLDFGLQISGPVAQQALATYDDLWDGSNQLVCDDLQPLMDWWEIACDWQVATATHSPEVLKYYLPPETNGESAFALFRSANYPEADQAMVGAISAATSSIDFFEVNFSMKIYCMLNVIDPSLCDISDALPFMDALLDALEKNPVKVRVLVTDVNSNGIENFIAIGILQDELAKRGLSELVEFRYWPERMHSKAILIDNQVLIIGSQNMHYSSFGENGLTEFSLATESEGAIETFQETFQYYWDQSLPITEQSKPGTSGE